MKIFIEKFSYADPFNIVFLCGSKFSKNPREKRLVLKRHLEATIPNCRVIVLEENFAFRNTTKKYLAYDDIFLYSLAQVEELASLFSSSVLIIHETISTAAELGMFANNPALVKKICLLTPDSYAVEENKVSSFIQLAFLQPKAPESCIGDHIIFYPDTELFRDSAVKGGYYTYFHNNTIGENLSRKICAFVMRDNVVSEVHFAKCRYHTPRADEFSIDYCLDKKGKAVSIYVHPSVFKVQLLSLFCFSVFQAEIQKKKKIYEHVSYIQNMYEELIEKSVAFYSGFDLSGFTISVALKNSKCELRQAVGYYIYMLQAINLICMEQADDEDMSIRKICITHEMEFFEQRFSSLIVDQPVTAFGGLGL